MALTDNSGRRRQSNDRTMSPELGRRRICPGLTADDVRRLVELLTAVDTTSGDSGDPVVRRTPTTT